MGFRRLFGGHDDHANEAGEGNVVLRLEVDGKTYVRRYPDLEMAQIRFPQDLADLVALHSRDVEDK